MFLNYLKVGLRNILKHKVFSFINLFGLAAAMAVCMLIILMVADQKSYDRFNTNKNSLYRILTDKQDFRHPYATSPFPMAGAIKANDPVVKDVTQLVIGVGGDGIRTDDPGNAGGKEGRIGEGIGSQSVEMRGYFASPSLFNLFSFELGKGNKEEALAAPNSMVLSSGTARRLFKDEDPMGKTIAFTDRGLNFRDDGESSAPVKWGLFTVTGVLADREYKSHLKFDVLISSSSMDGLIKAKKIEDITRDWKNLYHCYTYVLLKPGKNESDLNTSLNQVVTPNITGIPELKGVNMIGQKLMDISPGMILGNEPAITLPKVVYYFFSFLALMIMLSACLNYTNLAVARALTRAKEIGIRKVNGAGRKNIVFQFLSESILTALFALLMAILFLFFLRVAFLHLWVNQYLHFELKSGMTVYLIFLGLALTIGVISGLYPALYLSGFKPVKALRSLAAFRPGKLGMRKVLSVSQFAISLIFIISSLLIYNQSTHFLRFNYEFSSGNIVNVPLQGNDYRKVAGEIGRVPGIENVSACDYIPVTGRSEGTGLKIAGSTAPYTHLTALKTDEHFLDNLRLRLVAGRNFPAVNAPPTGLAGQQGPIVPPAGRYVVVNETAVKALGFASPSAIIGQSLVPEGNDSLSFQVAGVVQDFHMSLDQDQIQPLVLQNQPAFFKYVNVRIATGDLRGTMARLEKNWRTIDPVHSFKYQFFDEQLASTSRGFFDIVSILGFLAFIAVTIACLGMLGMATYTTERRTKEVGIRKALGAENFGIVLLLSKDFIRVLVLAILIAAPLSYFLNTMWLRNFPNRVDFGWGTILSGTGVLLVLGLITIGSQTFNAARRDPVKALKTE